MRVLLEYAETEFDGPTVDVNECERCHALVVWARLPQHMAWHADVAFSGGF